MQGHHCAGQRRASVLPQRAQLSFHPALARPKLCKPAHAVLRTSTPQTIRSTDPTAEEQSQANGHSAAPAPLLLSKLVKAHAARCTSILVLTDKPDVKHIVSASLDKTLANFRMTLSPRQSAAGNSHDDAGDGANNSNRHLQVTRLTAPGGPVFSLVRQPKPPSGSVFDPKADVLYIGNAAKEVVAWEVRPCLNSEEPCDAHFQTVATDYTGWVRSLALMGKWLFSCGCNYLVQHDTSFPIPKEVSKQELFKGDIQAIVTTSTHVYIAAADGALRAWSVSKTGQMQLAGEVPTAHESRISSLAIHGSTLYSVSFDGSIKAWNADKLQLVAEVQEAHAGEKVHSVVVGPDGLLYTGGDDKLIRCWRPVSPALDFLAALEPVVEPAPDAPPAPVPSLPSVGQPLSGHSASVRVLAAGSRECLVSGDSEGDMCIWALPRVH